MNSITFSSMINNQVWMKYQSMMIFSGVVFFVIFLFCLMIFFETIRKQMKKSSSHVSTTSLINQSRHFYEEPISFILSPTIDINVYDHVRDNYVWIKFLSIEWLSASLFVFSSIFILFSMICSQYSDKKNQLLTYESIFDHYESSSIDENQVDRWQQIHCSSSVSNSNYFIEKNQSHKKTINAKTINRKEKKSNSISRRAPLKKGKEEKKVLKNFFSTDKTHWNFSSSSQFKMLREIECQWLKLLFLIQQSKEKRISGCFSSEKRNFYVHSSRWKARK